jgi:hypothetical protein
MLNRLVLGCNGGLPVAAACSTAACAWWRRDVLQPPVQGFFQQPGSPQQRFSSSEASNSYGLSEEQENMFALAREFAREKMLPHAAAWEQDKV